MSFIQTPDWVKNAVFYQIFPDRFARSNTFQTVSWQSNNLESWDSKPTYEGYKGGNLWGVIEKLDYFQDLGINAIYLTPIFQSTSNHRYHTHDYYQVDPMLGGNKALDALVKSAHQRKIKIVLDGVFNHASRGFFFFNDILENGPNSPWLDWFKVEKWPLSAYDGAKPANYASWVGNRALPKFNHANPQVREYIMQIAEYWLEQGIDGWRLDVPNEVTVPGFWQEFRDRVKGINPEAYIVGEIWGDASQWLDGTQFDGVMNYRFAEPTIAFTAGGRFLPEYQQYHYEPYPAIDAQEYGKLIKQLLSLYDWEIQQTQLNLLDSHDTSRLLSSSGGDRDTVLLATTLLLTFPGAPCIYYGDEVGLFGDKDPDCRRGFPEKSQWDQQTWEHHKKLIALRHQYSALRTGKYEIIYAEKNILGFVRRAPNTLGTEASDLNSIVTIINASDTVARVNFAIEPSLLNTGSVLYGKGKCHYQENHLEVLIQPRQQLILV